ncbi:MAG: TetR/AcrR family transcriptional regulator [Bacteroidetes bacterium]|nr:TetR/AcrR family transcriptional regulator [Bacteroidota bacterium]
MDRVKERILTSATQRFFEYGITKVTLDEIVADVGISKKTLYKYFQGKDKLLEAVIRRMWENVRTQLHAICTKEQSFEEKLSLILVILGHEMRKVRQQFISDLQKYYPSYWKEIERHRQEIIVLYWKKLFQQAQKEGVFRADISGELFYLVFVSAVQGVLTPKVIMEQSFSVVDAMRGLLCILLEGAVTSKSKRHIHKFLESLDHHFMELEQ